MRYLNLFVLALLVIVGIQKGNDTSADSIGSETTKPVSNIPAHNECF